MLSRGLLGRLVPDVSKTASLDVSQLARSFHQLSLARNLARTPQSLHNGSVLSFQSLGGCRMITTAHAVRTGRAPAKKKTGKSTSKAKTATKKKAAPKKKPVKKAKRVTKKKKPAKKPAPRRKVLTEKQKETLAKKKLTAKRVGLKTISLPTVPKRKPATAWLVYNAEHAGKGITGTKENGPKFRALSPAEIEHYNHIANQNKADNERAYRAWVTSHTPEQIRQANIARTQLRRGSKHPHSGTMKRIEDPRAPKKPRSAWVLFVKDRWDSGDMKNVAVTDAMKLISTEWKALNASEKTKYTTQADSTKTLYRREFKSTYGRESPSVKAGKAA